VKPDYGPNQWFVDFLRMEKMIENSKIKKGPPKHNPVCYQTLQDVVIPAGTILRHDGYLFGCGVSGGNFSITESAGDTLNIFKKVIA